MAGDQNFENLDFSLERPFIAYSKNEIISNLEVAVSKEVRDIEVATLAYNELELRKMSGKAKSILSRSNIKPIGWLREAKSSLSLLEMPQKQVS